MNSFLRHCLQAFKLHLVGQQIQSHIMTLKRKFGRHTGKCTSYAERILIQECARPDLLPGSSSGSKSAADYRFRLLVGEIEEYTRLADLRHGLMLLRYGSSRLYPYLMTRVDIVPLLLKELPFHSDPCFVEVLWVASTATILTSSFIMPIHLVVVVGVKKNLSWRCSSGPSDGLEKRLSKQVRLENS